MRDFQKQKVYDWENTHILKKVSTKRSDIGFLRMIVKYIWNDLGFENPPDVWVNEVKTSASTGSRYEIIFTRFMMTEFTLIHELAHSMNQRCDLEHYDSHGPNYVADYCFLLHRYYKIDENYLIGTLSQEGVQINLARYYQHKKEHEV